MKKRLLAMVLAVMMVLSLLPTAAFAAEPAECDHDYSIKTSLKDATCKENGIAKETCSKCGANRYVSVPAGHTWAEDPEIIPATCTEPDMMVPVCAVCGAKGEAEPVEGSKALGHVYKDVHMDATCENPAGVQKTCQRCDDKVFVPYTDPALAAPATGHKYGEPVVTAPTCKEGGYTTKTCEVCGKVETYDKTAPVANAHQPKLVTELKAATCTTSGIGKYECAICGENLGYKVIPAAHSWVDVIEVEPTCVEDGKGYRYCTVCEEKEDLELPATGKHTWGEPDYIPATCTEPEKFGSVCTVCGTAGKTEIVDGSKPLGHDLEETYIPATCTEDAYVKITCKRCDFQDKQVLTGDLAVPATGHDIVTVVTAPTCKEGGYTTDTCKKCDYEKVYDKTAPVPSAHKAELVSELKAATCTANGIGKYACTICGEDLGYKVIPAAHSWVDVIEVEPTCVKDGKGYRYCTVCEEKEELELPATGKHTWSEPDLIEATCTEPAKYGSVCTVCGAAGETEIVDGSKPLGHDLVETYVPATCTEDAYVEITCKRCDFQDKQELTGDLAVPATGHKYGEPVVVEPNCKEGGYTTKACEVCGKVETYDKTDPVPGAHKPELDITLKAATCTTNGIGKYVCAICGENLGYKVIPAAHSWVDVIEVEPTCVEDGKGYRYCTVCEEKEELELPATGKHTWSEPGVIDATCTEPAKIGSVCTVCGAVGETEVIEGSEPKPHDYEEVIVEANCHHAGGVQLTCKDCGHEEFVPTLDGNGNVAYPQTSHEYEETEIEANCVHGGGILHVCKNCGDQYMTDETDPNPEAHVKGEPVLVLKAPTCASTGVGKFKCEICGKDLGYGVIEMLPHKIDPATAKVTKEPTCTEDGVLTFKCADCGASVTEPIDALGHSWGDVELNEDETKVIRKCTVCGEIDVIEVLVPECEHENTEDVVVTEATCTEPGVKNVVCADCGEVLEENVEIPALGHTEEVIPGKEPTETETGLTEGKKCSVCGEILVPQEEIPATGHIHTEEAIPGKAPTCTESGLTEGKKCSACGEILVAQEEIPALDHTEEVIPGKAPTCTESGLTEGKKCSICGTIIAAQEEITALDHTEEVIPGKAPTCTESGLTEGKKCSICGTIIAAQEEIPATGHNMVYSGYGFNEDGSAYFEHTCSNCGKVERYNSAS